MIDEPELNLHPSNQMLLRGLIANLVNLGIDVMITTHSDYMIKEFNNLIMLSNDFVEKERIMKENKYEEIDILHPDKVKAYFIEKHKILPAPIDNMGIELKVV
jgi:predicted ATPase